MASLARTHSSSDTPQRPAGQIVERNADTVPTVDNCSFIDEKEGNQLPVSGAFVGRTLRRLGTSTLQSKYTEGGPTKVANVGVKSKTDGGDATNIYVNSQQNIVLVPKRDPTSDGMKGNGLLIQHGGGKKPHEGGMTDGDPSGQQAITPSLEAIPQPESKNIDLQKHGIKGASLNCPNAIQQAVNKQQPLMPMPNPRCEGLNGKPSSAEQSEPNNASNHQGNDKTKGHGKNSVFNKALSSQLPTLLSTESETTLDVAGNAQSLIAEEDETTIVGLGVGLGELKYQPIKNKYRPVNSPRHNCIPKPHTPTRAAHITAAETKINESILQILSFIKNVSQERDDVPGGHHDRQFKVFLDANKEIVRGWRLLKHGNFKVRPEMKMAENVDCIHAILVAWGNDSTESGSWVGQAMELTELCLAFAREWEILTSKKLGVAGWFEMRQTTEGTLEEYTATETNESMEYIHPKSVDINSKSDSFNSAYNAQIASSTISVTSHENRSPQTLHASQPAPTKHKTSPNPTEAPITSITNYPPSSTTEEELLIHQRLSKIEAHLSEHHTSEQTIIRVLDMQRLLIQDITDAIFGDISKPNSNNLENRTMAKRTGLLMMSKALADDGRKKMSALEEENNKLKAEIDNLNIERQAKSSDAGQEIRELKKIDNSLYVRSSIDQNFNETSWVDEAWDGAMEMYWPQGDPTQVGRSGLGGGNMPALYKAGRGQGSGSGIGSCAVM